MTSHTFVDDGNKHFEDQVKVTYDSSSVGNELHSSAQTVFGKTRSKKRRLKLTESKKTWTHNQIKKYSDQIGITAHDRPHIVFTGKEVLAMPKELTAGRRTVTYKYLGICFRRAKTILINVKKHRSLEDLKHTIVHELVHYRFSYLKHGTKFENRISLVMAGKKYKVKALYSEGIPRSFLSSNQDQQERFEFRSTQTPCLSIIRPKKSDNNNICNHDEWSTEYLIDELFLRLASTKQTILYDDKCITVYKYYHQALALRKWIPIAKPVPAFIINKSDLTSKIIAELKILDDSQIILKHAAGRIFENIDSCQYHLSIARKLKVRLSK